MHFLFGESKDIFNIQYLYELCADFFNESVDNIIQIIKGETSLEKRIIDDIEYCFLVLQSLRKYKKNKINITNGICITHFILHLWCSFTLANLMNKTFVSFLGYHAHMLIKEELTVVDCIDDKKLYIPAVSEYTPENTNLFSNH
jgi:hypothetical protein